MIDWRLYLRVFVWGYWIAMALWCLWIWTTAFISPNYYIIYVSVNDFNEAWVELVIHSVAIGLTIIYVWNERKILDMVLKGKVIIDG